MPLLRVGRVVLLHGLGARRRRRIDRPGLSLEQAPTLRLDVLGQGAIETLIEALTIDIDWVRKHTEWGALARRWKEAGKPGPRGLLLRPPPLEDAERWIALRPAGAPMPTEETQAFIAESRRAETRRRNVMAASVAFAAILLVTAGAALFIARQSQDLAEERRRRAERDHVGHAVELRAERRRLPGHARDAAVERVEHHRHEHEDRGGLEQPHHLAAERRAGCRGAQRCA